MRRSIMLAASIVLSLAVGSGVFAQPGVRPGGPRSPDGSGQGPEKRPDLPNPVPALPRGPGGGPDDPGSPNPPGGGVPAVCGPHTLCPAEVQAVAEATATQLADDRMTVAVVDRLGNVLALFRKPGAPAGQDDQAVGLARTAAYFSHDQAPLSSRTVRFISGIHFPPGIERTPNAALYGIENTNRGCRLDPSLERGVDVAEGRSVAGILGDLRCDPFDRSGCGPGVVTGKADVFDSQQLAVNPGGVPIYKGGRAAGGVGVAGVPPAPAEYAAFQGSFGSGGTLPVPVFPLPPPGNVFVDGIRLPFVETVERPAGTSPGPLVGSYVVTPRDGREAPSGYLLPPRAGSLLSAAEAQQIVQQSIDAANRTRALIRLPLGTRARMAISVADLDGRLLALFRMDDATVFSIDVAASKARNVTYFSGDPASPLDLTGVPAGTAVTNRTISFGAQPLFPSGIDGSQPGPFFDLFRADWNTPCSQGIQPANPRQSGVVFFAGSIPLYRGRTLVGGLGISGDGVEQDDYVSFLGAAGFVPPEDLWANQVFVRGVRLPFLKFPRNPEE
jgi:uncharacterized protein GlcG (DUF336 family)